MTLGSTLQSAISEKGKVKLANCGLKQGSNGIT